MGFFPAAQAIEPIGHVRKILVTDAHGGKLGVTGQEYVLTHALFIDTVVLFVISFFFDQSPTRTTFATRVKERGFFAHDARVAGGIVSETGGIADQETLGIGN